mgnify:FL=1
MKKKYKLKGWVVFSVYVVSIVTIISSLYLVGKTLQGMIYSNESLSYVYRGLIDDAVPVISTTKNKKIIMPYQDETVKIIKNFYDKDSDNITQENSLILYENTYMPNTGIMYGSDNVFDVLAVLDGTIESVTTDDILGNIITIRHTNNLTTTYESLNNVDVIVGQAVNQGDIIGKSGTNKVDASASSMMLFEVNFNGNNINPSKIYDKELNELE